MSNKYEGMRRKIIGNRARSQSGKNIKLREKYSRPRVGPFLAAADSD